MKPALIKTLSFCTFLVGAMPHFAPCEEAQYNLRSELPLANLRVFKGYKIDDERVLFEFLYEGSLLTLSDFVTVLDIEGPPKVFVTFYGVASKAAGAPRKLDIVHFTNGNWGVYMICPEVGVNAIRNNCYYRDKSGNHQIQFSAEKPPEIVK